MDWHESNLAENRLPTMAELDAAAPDHPVLARRGGHFALANSVALRAAGIGADTEDPRAARSDEWPTVLATVCSRAAPVYQVAAFAPARDRAELAAALGTGSAAYAALGIGTIREPLIDLEELLAYQDARDRDQLKVRVRATIRVGNELSATRRSR